MTWLTFGLLAFSFVVSVGLTELALRAVKRQCITRVLYVYDRQGMCGSCLLRARARLYQMDRFDVIALYITLDHAEKSH